MTGEGYPSVPWTDIEALARTAQASAISGAATSTRETGTALTAQAKSNMLALGWVSAGSWYSTFAEVTASVADAHRAPAISSSGPLSRANAAWISATGERTREVLSFLSSSLAHEKTSRHPQEADAQVSALVNSGLRDFGCGYGNSVGGTATGNCSLGQGIVSAAIRGTAIGSGGGGNGSGLALDSSGFVNPIILMKNMGDYVLTFSSTAIFGGVLLSVFDSIPGVSTVGKWIGKGVGSIGGGSSDGTGLIQQASGWILSLGWILAVCGAAMSIYLPFVPFIAWIGAVIAYFTSVIEGLAGATLHAMSHLDADGDGFGSRTERGYIFWLNVLARPGLMLIGFFAGSAIMIGVGTLQAHLFLPAMAGVQGNSVTGLLSIIGLLIIFFMLNMTLINVSMNLIFVITDQVLGFLGGAVNSHLGREIEDKVNNMFLVAARFGPNAISDISKKNKKIKKSGNSLDLDGV